jgi:hypothetical protein
MSAKESLNARFGKRELSGESNWCIASPRSDKVGAPLSTKRGEGKVPRSGTRGEATKPKLITGTSSTLIG